MKPELIFKRDSKNVKRPLYLKNGVFLIYAPRKITAEPNIVYSNIVVNLPKDHKGYFTSIFKQNNIEAITDNTQRIWIGVLNTHFSGSIVIEKNRPLGFFATIPDYNISITHETTTSKKNYKVKNSKKYKKQRTQSGGFLNRYDFAYTGRDVVNQLGKVESDIIKHVRSEINNIAEQRINQAISQGGKELERVLANIFRGAIEDVYQTPFSLLGRFGKQQLQKLKNKVLR